MIILKDKVCLIGGLDQFNVLGGSKEEIRKEAHRLFEAYGKSGGYIISDSDHFFEIPKENLIAYAEEAKKCVY